MDRQTALKQLRLLELTCSKCSNVAPSYRMMIGIKKSNSQLQNIKNNNAENQQNTSIQDNSQVIRQQSVTKPAQLQYICITCFANQQDCRRDVSPFHQLALDYIKQVPLPDTAAAEHCLSVLKQIQEQSNQIIKQIMSTIDQFKFYVLKLVSDGTKQCENYISKVKQMDKLKVQQRYLLQMQLKHADNQGKSKIYNQIKNNYFINQTESTIKFTRKYKQLQQIKQKIATIKLTMPQFNSQQKQRVTNKRKNLFISDVPISSMTTMKGRNYYGCSDGHIIFPVLSAGTHSAHKGHDSLIRSFAHDNQFTLYSGSDDFTIKVRDGTSLKLIRTFGMIENNKSYHRNICVVEDGQALVSTRGQFDGFRIRVWGFPQSTGNQPGAISKGILQGHTSFIKAMAVVDKEANIIVTSSDDKTLKLWQTNKARPLISVPRPRKCQNLIVSQKYSLCCLVQQDNKISILDLQDNLRPVLSMTLPRKILCSCGYSRSYTRQIHTDNDYIVLCIPNCIGIYRWDFIRIKVIDVQVTFVPLACMQVGDGLVLSDGGGIVEEVRIGNIAEIQIKALAEHQNQG